MADAQFNMIPTMAGIPLNAVELMEAYQGKKKIVYIDKKGEVKGKREKLYMSFIPKYLYYMDIYVDNRYGFTFYDLGEGNDYEKVMLVPSGAKKPTIFQRVNPIKNCRYITSKKKFYMKP